MQKNTSPHTLTTRNTRCLFTCVVERLDGMSFMFLLHVTGGRVTHVLFPLLSCVLQQQQMYENPLYEQRRNLDRQAGLTSQTGGKKRKHEEEERRSKDKEEKSKHKKEKREKKTDDDPVQEEEAEERLMKKEGRILEEEKLSYKTKDDEEHQSGRKEEKSRYTRQEEDKVKDSRRADDDRVRYNREEHRYRYRRNEEQRYDDRPRRETRDKSSDPRSKYDREEGKLKTEKGTFQKPDSSKSAGKTEFSKSEPPPKLYDPPKIFCGPSPAMKAKLRKQNLEMGKPTPVSPSFGKFTWKKKENLLATEAQKAAAEFIKEDEAPEEECLAKSVAAAKEIAQKLATQQNTASPWVSNSSNQAGLRPSLPAPSAVLGKPFMMGKAAPLKSFQRPPNTSLSPQCDELSLPVPVAPNPSNSIRPQNPSSVNCPLEVSSYKSRSTKS